MTLNADRFWEKVNKRGEDGCWEWQGARNNKGYGVAWDGARVVLAHRLSYVMATGDEISGVEIDHICHNNVCVNPSHLRTATRGQNLQNRAGAKAGSRSGVRGVSWSAPMKKWRARVNLCGVEHLVGYYDNIEEAGEAARLKRLDIHTHHSPADRGH